MEQVKKIKWLSYSFLMWICSPLTQVLSYINQLFGIFIDPNPNQLEIDRVQERMKRATCYNEWLKDALRLDELEGNNEWKATKESSHYDHELIEYRMNKLRELSAQRDIHGLVHSLRAGLLRNLGGLGNSSLHTYCHVGTKYLIENYIDEVVNQLDQICDDLEIEGEFGLDRKFDLFYETRQAFGRTALLLSGGAGLGMYHFGVVKGLFEAGLLPRVISGSSVGSLIAAIVCTTTDSDFPRIFEPGTLTLDAFEKKQKGSLKRKFNRLIEKGVLMDIKVLESVTRTNIGDITFKEAYDKTGRVLNIPIASTKKFEYPRLLNYLSAPNVLIWSAACASCAFPGLYEPVQLMCKDQHGNIVEYHPSGLKWSDGSLESDLPMQRLSELFNVNHFIVSQVNPHVAPFLRNTSRDRNSGILGKIKFLIKSEIKHRILQMAELGIFSSIVTPLQPLITQKYEGDITIVPEITLDDYKHIISNPDDEFLSRCTQKGLISTYSKIRMISTHLKIELCLENCVKKIRKRYNSPEYYEKIKLTHSLTASPPRPTPHLDTLSISRSKNNFFGTM